MVLHETLVWERLGIDTSRLGGETYEFGLHAEENPLQPRVLRRECLSDYLAYCESFVNPGKQRELDKLMLARAVLNRETDVIIAEHLGALYKYGQRAMRAVPGVTEKSSLGEILGDGTVSPFEQIIIDDLETFMQTRDTPCSDAYELVLEKFDPEVYRAFMHESGYGRALRSELARKWRNLKKDVFVYRDFNEHVELGVRALGLGLPPTFIRAALLSRERSEPYKLEVTNDASRLKWVTQQLGESCIRDYPLADFERWIDDPGTEFIIGSRAGRYKGYARCFWLRSGKGEPIFAIDTLETPHKDFHAHAGLLNGLALAAIQYGLDAGAKYVIGADARVRYGPRQAFGNTKKRIRYEKLGDQEPFKYSFDPVGDSEAFLLMRNWRVC